MQTNISITKDKFPEPKKDPFWIKVLILVAGALLIFIACTWYAYSQGYAKGYKRGLVELMSTDDCAVSKEVRYNVRSTGKN